ncbi:MAG: GNAT family N-acetyltransferase [Myxococcales bacterium]|nr:MAG: GNAT family N-acetyltransferase [Myxococcales bacterium]
MPSTKQPITAITTEASTLRIARLKRDGSESAVLKSWLAQLEHSSDRQLFAKWFRLPQLSIWIAAPLADLEPRALAVGRSTAEEYELYQLMTIDQYRRQGLASVLLGQMFDDLRKDGVKQLFLEVRADNHAAIKLYRSMGFELLQTRPAYYPDGADALNLGCDL